MLFQAHGNALFSDVLGRWRCKLCGKPPAPVYLVAGHHRHAGPGPSADWSLELIRAPHPT